MVETRSRPPNVTDMVLGMCFLLLLPIVTLALLKNTRQEVLGQNPGGPAAGLPAITVEEIDDAKAAYEKIYDNNYRFFRIRMDNGELAPEHRAQETAWARAVVTRCRQAFQGLIEKARATPIPEVQARIPDLETWTKRFDGELQRLGSPVAASPR